MRSPVESGKYGRKISKVQGSGTSHSRWRNKLDLANGDKRGVAGAQATDRGVRQRSSFNAYFCDAARRMIRRSAGEQGAALECCQMQNNGSGDGDAAAMLEVRSARGALGLPQWRSLLVRLCTPRDPFGWLCNPVRLLNARLFYLKRAMARVALDERVHAHLKLAPLKLRVTRFCYWSDGCRDLHRDPPQRLHA